MARRTPFLISVSAAILGAALVWSATQAAESSTDSTPAPKATSSKATSPATPKSASTTSSSAAKPTTVASPTGPGPAAVRYKLPQVDRINEQIRRGWVDHGVHASQPADDATWCRRVYLDVLGRVPSVVELNKFLSDKSNHKRYDLVDRLLSKEYADDYTRNWTAVWTNLLIGRTGGVGRDPTTNREAMSAYVHKSLAENKPYDQFMTELVTATGSNTPDGNGAVNFLTGKMADHGLQATAKTAQLFLGMQVQCTQCHNHPFNDYKQNQFWELNAFFRQTVAQADRKGPKNVTFTLKDQDFREVVMTDGVRRAQQQDGVFYELRNGTMKIAYPVFIDGTEINKSGLVRDVDRRVELAKLIRSSPNMPRAIVNRMWAHFLGYGFTKPVDDMGPHNPPTHPELLDALAADFTASGFNLKELIRWIVLSEPYGLSARFNSRNQQDDPILGEKPQFSHFYLRQMRLEELYESLLTATEAAKGDGTDREEREKQKQDWLRQFTFAFGTDDNEETTTFNGTIPQALMMFNGELIRTATKLDADGYLQRVAANDDLDSKQKITYLYQAALARRPTTAEVDEANRLWAERKGDVPEALADVWWALLNSNEFILNH